MYLDYMASTPMCGPALEVYKRVSTTQFGNASGVHGAAISARRVIADSERTLLNAVGLDPDTDPCGILWASSASDATARWADALKRLYIKRYVHLYNMAEHRCVVDNETIYMNQRSLSVNDVGAVTIETLASDLEVFGNIYYEAHGLDNILTEREPWTYVMSVMHVNNELGTINDIESIARIMALYPNIKLHVDAAQSFGKLPIDMKAWGIKFLTISGHKIHGPKGLGGIIYNDENFQKLIQSSRPKSWEGTSNTSGIAACASAYEYTHDKFSKLDWDDCYGRRELFVNALELQIDRLVRKNHHRDASVPWCVNLYIDNIDNDLLVMSSDIPFSTGSSCNSSSIEPSHVLRACGYEVEYIVNCVRFSFDPITTTSGDLVNAATYIAGVINAQTV